MVEQRRQPHSESKSDFGSDFGSDFESRPVCKLVLRRDALLAVVEHRNRIIERSVMPGAHRSRLQELSDEHRMTFETGWSASPYDLWSTATEKFLAEVHDLISGPLQTVLGGYSRVALELTDPILARLPIETAHRFESPALFELLQVYRSNCDAIVDRPSVKRRFALDLRRGDTSGLHAVATEEALVRSSYRAEHHLETQRMVHVVGHDPMVDADLGQGEQAHLVLSGCDSLPRSLPAGVASATGTLWPIDDHTNAATISLFHSRVSLGIGPLEALRQTQLLQRCMPPVVWAAYVHFGQPD